MNESALSAPPLRILLTGGSGFVGSRLLAHLLAQGHHVVCALRPGSRLPPVSASARLQRLDIEDIARHQDWSRAMHAVDAVVHLASRVHVMREHDPEPLARFREVNVEATRRLAEAAVAAGVGRFVYVSSIKVNGERTMQRPFHADDAPAPADPYAQSKCEAELLLRDYAADSDCGFVVIRPPLVYGPGAKGNFALLVRLVRLGWPLPLAAVDNLRSMVSLDNLIDFIGLCLLHPRAIGQTFLIADGEDWSTPRLIATVAAAMGRPVRLFRVPVGVLRWSAAMLGKGAEMDRLSDSLQVDITKNLELLGWRPVQSPAWAVPLAVRAICAADPHA